MVISGQHGVELWLYCAIWIHLCGFQKRFEKIPKTLSTMVQELSQQILVKQVYSLGSK